MDDEDIDGLILNRRIALDMASRDLSVFGPLADLECLAEPYFLGTDEDPDDADLVVYP